MYNMQAEEDGASSAAAHSLENAITMNKMKLLKAKMEDMNLNRKVGGKISEACLYICYQMYQDGIIFMQFCGFAMYFT